MGTWDWPTPMPIFCAFDNYFTTFIRVSSTAWISMDEAREFGIDLSSQASGVYYLRAISGKKNKAFKIYKE